MPLLQKHVQQWQEFKGTPGCVYADSFKTHYHFLRGNYKDSLTKNSQELAFVIFWLSFTAQLLSRPQYDLNSKATFCNWARDLIGGLGGKGNLEQCFPWIFSSSISTGTCCYKSWNSLFSSLKLFLVAKKTRQGCISLTKSQPELSQTHFAFWVFQFPLSKQKSWAEMLFSTTRWKIS